MKKVIIVTALAGFIRGFLTNDIHILQDMGYEVHCAADGKNIGANDIEKYFKENNVVFHQVDFSSSKPISKNSVMAFKQLNELFKQEKFDIVHVHTPIAGVLTRLVTKKYRKEGLKVVYTTHGFYFHEGSSKKNWLVYYNIEKWMSKYTDMMITINTEDYNAAKTMKCNNVKKINGVGFDSELFIHQEINRAEYREKIGIKKDDIMVFAIGELSERKNHQIIIKALAKLNNPNIIFAIAGRAMSGTGTYDQLVTLAKENNVRLQLLGFRADIPQLCHCADIGAFPSTREGLGFGGLELLAAGVPVVASNVHGIKDYMRDGKNGYLVSPYDEDAFKMAFEKLMDKELRESMKQECIESTKMFDKNISQQQMLNIYKEVCK